MHYMLWVPGKTGASNNCLNEWGLGGLVDQCGPAWRDVDAGLNGKRGALATWNAQSIVNIDEGQQTWIPSPAKDGRPEGTYWFGFDPADRPTAVDLERPKIYRATNVLLADGTAWQIPIIPYLPATYGKNYQTGETIRKLRPEFENLAAKSKMYEKQLLQSVSAIEDRLEFNLLGEDEGGVVWAEHLPSGSRLPVDTSAVPWTVHLEDQTFEVQTDDVVLTLSDAFDYCVDLLRLHYRLTTEFVDWLALLDDPAMISVVHAATEMDVERRALQHAQKKNPTITATVGELT